MRVMFLVNRLNGSHTAEVGGLTEFVRNIPDFIERHRFLGDRFY
jgi:hypothetical protein